MSDLCPEEFPKFFSELYGFSPFPWQKRLAERIFTSGWELLPKVVDQVRE